MDERSVDGGAGDDCGGSVVYFCGDAKEQCDNIRGQCGDIHQQLLCADQRHRNRGDGAGWTAGESRGCAGCHG